MIELAGVRKSFGPVTALAGVSFAAGDGRITGILGPNGAGKTTALRILSGVLAADGGVATVDGVDVARSPLEAQRRLGVLPSGRGLYPRLTAREHVRYFGRLQGLEGAALERRIDALVELLAMQELIDRRTEGFSEGQRLRVAIARALVHDPRNVVLDEPTGGLDVAGIRAMREVVRRLRAEGRCVLFSSHVMQEVTALCDRVVVIAHGRVVAEGSPDELRARTGEPSLEDAFVAVIGTEEGLA